jgi:S1/P1 Nuclease
MRRLAALLVFGTVAFGWVQPTRAWDDFGHMLVAASAYDDLTPPVKKKVDALVKLNPQYSTWVKGVAAKDKGKVAFMMAARWPDWIKLKGSGHVSDGPDGGNRPPDDPSASQNIGYTDTAMHKYWHFIDEPFVPPGDGTSPQPPPSVNAQSEIALLRTALKSGTKQKLKSYDLVWLEHIVGDVHQPLHCTSRFDAADKSGDSGGNNVLLAKGSDYGATELHALWDDFPGTSKDPTAAIAVQTTLPAPDKDKAAITDETKWIDESFQAAKTSAYTAPIGIGDGPFTPTPPYLKAGKDLSAARISLGAARLANLLNDALK